MRKETVKLEDIINKIKQLKGQDINLEVSRGRKKTEYYYGKIENIYPSIFTVKLNEEKSSLSFSFADVLCGVVSLSNPILPQESQENAESIN
ncbi:MAG: Veg family protein [Clostridia bacterium]|nr:Veg family protein [Clostridia bacterium]